MDKRNLSGKQGTREIRRRTRLEKEKSQGGEGNTLAQNQRRPEDPRGRARKVLRIQRSDPTRRLATRGGKVLEQKSLSEEQQGHICLFGSRPITTMG